MSFPSPADARPATWRRRVISVGLAVLAAALLVSGAAARDTSTSTASSSPGSQASAEPSTQRHVTRPRATQPETQPQPAPATVAPTRLRIPAIGVATDLVRLGLHDDNTVEVPEDPDEAGWFDLGPPPGRPGSAVILGHVDSTVGPAVFYRLGRLETGDEVTVRLADGTTVVFAVTRVATYANDAFPAQRVYAGSPGKPVLNLVTCGGRYDPEAGGYQSNVVVYTRHLRTHPVAS